MTRIVVLAISLLLSTACSKSEAPGPAPEAKPPASAPPAAPASEAAATAPAPGPIDITVTEKGFEPDKVRVKAGVPTKLAFTRKTDKTCATEVVLQLGDGQKVEKKLPLNETVEIDATFAKAGDLTYACAMDMFKGVVSVE